MESGLLRVTLKPNPQSGAPSAQTTGDAQLPIAFLTEAIGIGLAFPTPPLNDDDGCVQLASRALEH
jgi:hypothetical protein